MKVAMVTPYWSPVIGGITTYVQELAAELRRTNGFDVSIVAREGQGGPRVTILGGSAKQFARTGARELERIQPDVVHAHGHWYTLAAGLRYRRRHPQARVILTLHSAFQNMPPWRRYGLKLELSKADIVTGVSADLLGRTLRSIGLDTRTRVTYPGVTVPAVRSDRVEELVRIHGLAARRPVVGYLGQMVWEEKVRGVAQLIRAMGLLRRELPTATLVVAGDGKFRKALEELAAVEAPGGVIFIGGAPDAASWFFGALDVYAHITFEESLGLSVLEAMANGIPVVATAVGGVPEVVFEGRNGLLTSGNPPEIAQRILEVLSSPTVAERLTSNAKTDVQTRFSWQRAARRFLSVYGAPTRHAVAITVDLERDYRATGPAYRGVEEAMPKILNLLEEHHIKATFFVTSELCDRFPDTLKEIEHRGHQLGCHGESHDVEFVSSRSYEWQLNSIRRATEAIEGCVGIRPCGFRAPNFSANGDTIRVLEELGYHYDSSVLPGRVVKVKRLVRKLDFLVAPRDPYRPSRDDPAIPGVSRVWEIPVTENPLALGGPIGLGYVNAYGVERALDAIDRCSADLCVFLIHPWELVDPPPGRIPKWMEDGCSSDASKMDTLLSRVRGRHYFTALESELSFTR